MADELGRKVSPGSGWKQPSRPAAPRARPHPTPAQILASIFIVVLAPGLQSVGEIPLGELQGSLARDLPREGCGGFGSDLAGGQ